MSFGAYLSGIETGVCGGMGFFGLGFGAYLSGIETRMSTGGSLAGWCLEPTYQGLKLGNTELHVRWCHTKFGAYLSGIETIQIWA